MSNLEREECLALPDANRLPSERDWDPDVTSSVDPTGIGCSDSTHDRPSKPPMGGGQERPPTGYLEAACRTAAVLFSTPFVGVSRSDGSCRWHSAMVGFAADQSVDDVALFPWSEHSHDLVVRDTLADARFADTRLVVGDPRLRFYAAIPLASDPGLADATFFVADVRPRPDFGDEQLRRLRDVAAFVEAHMRLLAMHDEQVRQAELLTVTLDSMDQGLIVTDVEDRIRVRNGRVAELIGVPTDLLAEGAPFDALRRFQEARGEFVGLPPSLRRWLETGDLELRIPVYERECANGNVVEVRTTSMGRGGTVRTYTDVTARRAAERALLDGERRYRLITENANDVTVLYDLDLRRLYVSSAIVSILGREPSDLIGRTADDLVHPDDVSEHLAFCEDVRGGHVARALTTQRHRHADGRWVWMEVSLSLTRNALDGRPDGFVATLRDVDARKAAQDALRSSEARLRISEERLALALDSGDDGIFDVDLENGTCWTSKRWLGRLGFPEEGGDDSADRWPGDIHPDDEETFRAELRAHLDATTAGVEHEHRLRKADGSYVWTLTRARVSARGDDGRPLRIVGTHIDITRRKEAEARITHMAEHDALTDLPNRHLFRRRLAQAIERAADVPDGQAVLACDLDGFKAVNDTLGHAAGDALLRVAAGRLLGVVGPDDLVARLGGDEFAVILANVEGGRATQDACARIIAAFAAPAFIDGVPVHVGIGVGAALVGDDGASVDEVFKRADMALYEAKAAGRGMSRLHEAFVHARAASRSSLALDMPEAIRRCEFSLVYQPVVDVTTGAVTSFEALMRWHHPHRGMVGPGEFIPVAEETGLIATLGAWALVEACREATGWPEGVRVAVNVSPIQFQDDLKATVAMALRTSGLRPGRLMLEVTESALMRDPEQAQATLRVIRDTGVLVALDDFGTGFSSLSYLRRFPYDKLKIDRSFIRDISDPDAAAIVRAVVGIGERLGMTIVAEGVETLEQLELVRREGCKQVQGFLFSAPLPGAQVQAYLTSRATAVSMTEL